uniref:Transformation/transcription domain-associated protein n=1 Tax=Macrostomum lignano TaxID=282301 RepID=A0A1I8HRP7_9PLAT
LPTSLPQTLQRLPPELTDPVEKMLDRESRVRPSADLFAMNKCFQDLLLLGLEGLVTCEAKTLSQKIDFFKMLMTIMMREHFPKPIVYRRVVPLVAENLWLSADLTPFVLPCLLRIIMHSTAEEFRSHLSEHTLAVLRRPRTAQVNK